MFNNKRSMFSFSVQRATGGGVRARVFESLGEAACSNVPASGLWALAAAHTQQTAMLATATRVTVGRHCLRRRLVSNPLASLRRAVVASGHGSRRYLSASDDREKEIAAELSRAPAPTPPPLGNTQQQRAATEILINRSGLMPTRMTHQKDDRPPLTGLAKELEQMIVLNGPITVPEYMIYALQHPKYGYYMRQDDKIGRGGDFITAPEISQVRKSSTRIVGPFYLQQQFKLKRRFGG